MSGHTNFTAWIDRSAGYVLIDGTEAKIIDTFFTGDPHGIPNSDVFNIRTPKGDFELSDSRLDSKDLRDRHDEYLLKR